MAATKKQSKELQQEMKDFAADKMVAPLAAPTLSESDKEELKEFLEENMSEDAKFLDSLPSNNGIDEAVDNQLEDIIEERTVNIDPNTGSVISLEGKVDAELAKMLDINIEDLYEIPKSAAEIPYDPELIKSNGANYGLKESDMIALLPVIDDFRAGKDKNWYSMLPDSIKQMINKQCAYLNNNSQAAKKLFAEELIRGLIRDAGIDRITIDLQKVTEQAFGEGLSGIMKMTLDYQRTILETKFLENAERLEAEGKTEKAEHLKKVAEAYRQSYTLENFIAAAKTGKLRVKKFDLEKYGRYIAEFNHKYETDTPFVINDISGIAPILVRKFFETFTTEEVITFIIAFCKFCRNMNAKDVIDHTFMSYVIINVSTLDLIVKDQEEGAFVNTLTDSLHKAIAASNFKEV